MVIPGLPDPNSGKIYKLQVSNFSNQEEAARTAHYVRSAGFNVAYEMSGSLYRVIAIDIPSSLIYYALQRLETIGIAQVWVRESL